MNDLRAMGHVSGITGAGPIFHTVMEAAVRLRSSESPAYTSTEAERVLHQGLRDVEVCALSGGLAMASCPHKVHEWVATDAIVESCSMHERVRIQKADGLRAGNSCSPDEVVERTFERFSSEYLSWAEATSRPMAPRDFSPLCPDDAPPARAAAGAVRTLYPADGARFALDPERAPSLQVLDVHLAVPEDAREAALLVDGQVVDRVSPFVANWAPGSRFPHALGAHKHRRRQ